LLTCQKLKKRIPKIEFRNSNWKELCIIIITIIIISIPSSPPPHQQLRRAKKKSNEKEIKGKDVKKKFV